MQNKITDSRTFLGKLVKVTVDRPLGTKHPKHKNIVYELNYGYVPGTISGDGEELDSYVLGIDQPIREFQGTCVAVIRRRDEQDDKLVVTPDGVFVPVEEILKKVHFQEKYFTSDILTIAQPVAGGDATR